MEAHLASFSAQFRAMDGKGKAAVVICLLIIMGTVILPPQLLIASVMTILFAFTRMIAKRDAVGYRNVHMPLALITALSLILYLTRSYFAI